MWPTFTFRFRARTNTFGTDDYLTSTLTPASA